MLAVKVTIGSERNVCWLYTLQYVCRTWSVGVGNRQGAVQPPKWVYVSQSFGCLA